MMPLAEAGIDECSGKGTPEIFVIDLRGGEHARGHVGAAIKAGRRDAYGMPLIFIVAPDQYGSETIGQLIGLEFLVSATEHQRPLINMIQRCGLDMARAQELGIRQTAMISLGMAPIAHSEPVSPDVIALLCEPSPEALTALSGMATIASVNAVMKPSQVLQALEFGKTDSLVVLAAKNRRPQAAMIKLLRRHSDLYSIPIVVLETSTSRRHLNYWSSAGADSVLAANEISPAIALVERLRRVRQASIAIDTNLRASTLTDRGQSSRLASGRFFEACLATRLQRNGMPFALAALRLDPATGDGDIDTLSEAAIYLAMSGRTTDLFTRVAPDVFLMSFSACDKLMAQKTVDAMTGMISDLRFGPQESSCTFAPVSNIALSNGCSSASDLIAITLGGLPARSQAPVEFA